ncbi:efflux RND transporter permease subunit [Rhodanobacter denitrificans]|uniref:efflux RND transporter permease subunit n=1 Tax=Rhodanobacter TaxID=75309 RepID=UPI000260D083|nr:MULTISPECIES: efflux RND transporter permease subunit [Rhodanobacter]EIM04296.1 acriflavin resistance protein [Rhodanobacter denitrificans]UJM89004.1 efflux RND transporter permease subunit [Rhodanobacter denitrificans]
MNVSLWMQRHRRSLLFLALMLTLGGLASALRMPVALFPNVAFPRVQVTVDAGDRPADQMAVEVTRPVEEAIRRVRGVRDVRSTTSRGSADIAITFDWGWDMAAALQEVNGAAGQVLPQLPAGTQLSTRRMDPTTFPVLAYSLRSHTLSPSALHDLAEYQLRPLLSGITGVAQVNVQGGEVAEFHADVDPARLRATHLSVADVATAVGHAATIQAMGRVSDHYKLFLLLADNQPRTVAALRGIVLRADARGVVRLGDVATVSLDHVPQWIRVNADGQNAVLLQVYQQPDGNSVQIAKQVKQRLSDYAPQMPAGVRVANWYDQTQLVTGAAASVRDAILIGIVLAGLVLFVFLRNTRVIAVALIVVPAVLAITVLLLSVLGMSFNMMTLGGMAAAVGLIIDDVIVMIEHIMRRLNEGEGAVHERVAGAANEFTRPLSGSSAATVVIFLPLAFLSGVTGAFFKALSLTMASALIISYLLTWVAVPLLAERFLDERHRTEHPPGRFTRGMMQRYERTLESWIKRPLLALLLVVPLVVLGGLAYTRVGTGFMPSIDEGGFILDYLSKPGTSLEETDRLLNQVETIIRANPYVDTYSRRTGLQLGGGLTEANQGDFFVRLKNGSRPDTEQVMEQVRTQVEQKVPGLDIELSQLMEDLIGDLVAVPQPIEVQLYSDDTEQLDATARKVADAIGKINGVVGVRDGINPAGDALMVQVDPVKAALEGLDPAGVVDQVGAAIDGSVVARLPVGSKVVGVRVRLPLSAHQRLEQVASLQIRAPDGHLFPLSRVATLKQVQGQPQITRDNLKRMVAVTGRISGRSLGSAIADVKNVLAKPGVLPKGMFYQLGGLYQQQQEAFRGLTIVMVAAIALVFTLLLFLYESFRVALAILAMPLLAIPAVFLGLWLTGIELNISAMMGMTMIVGIVTEVAIFYFSELQDIPDDAPLHDALHQAGQHRTRPILMSTLAAILTLLPLALAIGQGSQMQQPLAIAIISGMLVQVPLVLLVMPVLYARLKRPWRRKH